MNTDIGICSLFRISVTPPEEQPGQAKHSPETHPAERGPVLCGCNVLWLQPAVEAVQVWFVGYQRRNHSSQAALLEKM